MLPRADHENCGLHSLDPPAGTSSGRCGPTSAGHAARAVVAGGHSLVRATRGSLAARAGFEVVADTADATEAARAARQHGAALALVDVSIDGGCVPAVRKLVDRMPGIAVLVVAPRLDARVLLAVVRAGAEGLLTEATGAAGFARAVDAALHGEAVIPRDGVAALIEEVQSQVRRPAADVTLLPRRRAASA